MTQYTIRQEVRDERNDVFSILTTDKQLNEEKTTIIEVETEVKKDITKEMLLKEIGNMKYLIYKYKNKINNKTYIGQTKNFTRRQYEHLRSSILGYDNFTFHKAIKKYGIENFDIEIVCYCNSKEELNEKEIYYIEYYKSFVSDGGYNLTRGGDGLIGFIQSDVQRGKTRERMKGNKYSVGYIPTIEHRRKISEAHTGKKRPQCGWVHTEEQKKQMSIKMKGRVFTKEHKEKKRLKSYENRDKTLYKFINTLTNEEIILSPYDFSKQYNIDRSSVTKLKLGKVKVCKGWILKEASYCI